jgi:hypothetical protein
MDINLNANDLELLSQLADEIDGEIECNLQPKEEVTNKNNKKSLSNKKAKKRKHCEIIEEDDEDYELEDLKNSKNNNKGKKKTENTTANKRGRKKETEEKKEIKLEQEKKQDKSKIKPKKEKKNGKKEENKSNESIDKNPKVAEKEKKKKKDKKEKEKEREESPKKESTKKTSSTVSIPQIDVNDPRQTVLDYMMAQNRPYSLINICDNLHGSIKKAQLQKILDSLTEEGELLCKEYQSKIYLISQKNFRQIDNKEMEELDIKLEKSTEELKDIKQTNNSLQTELKNILTKLSDEEINNQIKTTKESIKEMETKIKKIQDGSVKLLPLDQVKVFESNYEKAKLEYKKAKKIFGNVADTISDGLEMKRNNFLEMLNIEDDSDALNSLKIKI